MRTDLALSTFGTSWTQILDATRCAEDAGVTRVWIMDHLSGAVHGKDEVLECWTTLAGLAASTSTIGLGSLVTNAIVRNPVLLANTAATVQAQSDGRLMLGLGAGGGPGTLYDDELRVAGLPHGESAAVRRERVEHTLDVIDDVWSGRHELGGYLAPDPRPEILVAGYGPKMAAIAAARAHGFNTWGFNPDLERCCDIVRGACEISVWVAAGDDRLSGDHLAWMTDLGVTTTTLIMNAPFDHSQIAAYSQGSGR